MWFQNSIIALKAFKPVLIVANLGLILTKVVKVVVIFRLVKGFVILIGLITLLKWVGYDFTHVLDFFALLPELANLEGTWIGDIYNAIFRAVLEFINGIAENAPEPPDGEKIMRAIKKVVVDGKNM